MVLWEDERFLLQKYYFIVVLVFVQHSLPKYSFQLNIFYLPNSEIVHIPFTLTPLATIFQLYRSGLFYCSMKPEYPEKTTNMCKPLIKCITNIAIKEIYTQVFVSNNKYLIMIPKTFGSLNEYVIL